MASPPDRRGRALRLLLMLGLLAAAFRQNLAVTADLAWPGSDIQYREMAAAQTMLDQGYGPDSSYRGESLWYNPLSGWLAALGSVGLGRPLREVVPRLGPFVNLLAPLLFYLLVAALVDDSTALAATAAFLFITGSAFPGWEAASYSPWFSPENFGQGFLYLSLLLALCALRSPRPLGWHLALGLSLGVTFLTHTAPALLVGTIAVILAVWRARRGGSWRVPAGLLASTLTVAFLTSLPLVWHVVGRYHLAVVNTFPSEAPSETLRLSERAHLLAKLVTRSPFVVAAVALPLFVWPRRRSVEGAVLLAWMLAVLLFLAYGDVRSMARMLGQPLPAIVPSFHFLFHGMALVSVGFGIALTAVARRLAPGARSGEVLAAALLGACLIAAWGPHARRYDLTELRQEALAYGHDFPAETYAWIRSRTAAADVFLATDEMALFLITPAARKVVCTNRYFSNPYVDWTERDRARTRLYERLRAGDLEGFDREAAPYDLQYVVASDGKWPFPREKPPPWPLADPPLTRAHMAGLVGFEASFVGEGLGIYRRLRSAR